MSFLDPIYIHKPSGAYRHTPYMHTNVHTYTHTYICSLWGSLGGMGTQRESTEDRPWEGSPKGGVDNEFYGELTMKKP